jgi:hypothetical protein
MTRVELPEWQRQIAQISQILFRKRVTTRGHREVSKNAGVIFGA